MIYSEISERFELCPVVAAVRGDNLSVAVASPIEVIFLLEANILNVGAQIELAHKNNKLIFIHIDLIKGVGKDKSGLEYLANLGADGIISTRAPLIKNAKELGLVAVQRYFAMDSQGLETIKDMISFTKPDFIEIMPGIAYKVISKFVSYNIPVIAGGLIETKSEVTTALGSGACAVSTGKSEIWYI